MTPEREPQTENLAAKIIPNAEIIFSDELRADVLNEGAFDVSGEVFSKEEMGAIEQDIMTRLKAIDEKKRNPYHNADHAKDVLDRVRELLKESGVPADEAQVMELAALYHDYDHPGKIVEPGLNEINSAKEADNFAKAKGLSVKQRVMLQGLIIGTTVKKEGVGARTKLEKLFALADGADWTKAPEQWLRSRASLIREVEIWDPKYLPEDINAWLDKGLKWFRERITPEVEKLWGEKLIEKEEIVRNLLKNRKNPFDKINLVT